MRFIKYITIFFAIGIFFGFGGEVKAAEANSVCLGVSCIYSTITSAVAVSEVGSTITTLATYDATGETFPLTFSTSSVTLDCSASPSAILNNNGASLAELDITAGVTDVTIRSCHFYWTKIHDSDSDNLVIRDNVFTANTTSTILIESGSPDNPYIYNNTGLNGIDFVGVTNGRIVSNTIYIYKDQVGVNDTGITVEFGSTTTTINSNTITSNLAAVLIEIREATSTAITSNTLRYATSSGTTAIIIGSDPVGATVSGNYLTFSTNTLGYTAGIEVYPYSGVVRANITNNTIMMPVTGEACDAIKISDGTESARYSAYVTSTYNLIYGSTSIGYERSYIIQRDDVTNSTEVKVYEDYNGYYSLFSNYIGVAGITFTNGGHSVTTDPVLRSTDTASEHYLHPVPYSNYLDINGTNDIGAFSAVRDSVIDVAVSGVVNYSTIDATSTQISSINTNNLRTGDTLNLAAGTFDNFSITTTTVATSSITIQGAGATTIVSAGASQNGITLTGFADSTVKDLVVQNAPEVSSNVYRMTQHPFIYNDGTATNTYSSLSGITTGNGLLLWYNGSFGMMGVNSNNHDISVGVAGTPQNWNLALGRIGANYYSIYVSAQHYATCVEVTALLGGPEVEMSTTTPDYFCGENVFRWNAGSSTYDYYAPTGPVVTTTYQSNPALPAITKSFVYSYYSGIKLSNTSGTLVENVTSTANGRGVWFTGNTSGTNVSSSVFSGNIGYDIYSDASGDNNLKNSSFNTASSSIASTGDVSVFFKARGYVSNASSAAVNIGAVSFDAGGATPAVEKSTDATGYTSYTDNLLAWTMDSTSISQTNGGYNPFIVSVAAFDTYAASSTSANLNTRNQTFNLVLASAASAGITVTESSGTAVTEGGATDTFTVVLTAAPTADVNITLSSGVDATTTPITTLTFTTSNWSTPQTVTVTAVDDTLDETDTENTTISFAVASSDGAYSVLSITPVTVVVTDNDDPPTVTLSQTGSPIALEAGGTATVTATLSTASAKTVTVNLAFSGTATHLLDYTTSSAAIVISAGQTSGSVTITSVADILDEANETVIVDISSVTNGTESGTQQVTVTINDDDTSGVVISASALSVTEAGATATYTAVLNLVPTSDVTLTITAGSGVSASLGSIVFTTGNWSTPVTVTVTATDDAVYQGTRSTTISHTVASSDGNYNGIAVGSINVTILDNEEAPVVVTTGGGGGSAPAAPAAPASVSSPVITQSFSLSGSQTVHIGNAVHKITVSSVGQANDSVTFTVESKPVTVTLKVGEEKLIDSNADGQVDLYFKLNSLDVVNKTMNLTAMSLDDIEFSINNNLGIANSHKVKLYFNSPDSTFIAVSNSSDFSGVSYEPYTKEKEWLLLEGNGNKTVYVFVKFRTAQGGDKVLSRSVVLEAGASVLGETIGSKIEIANLNANSFQPGTNLKYNYQYQNQDTKKATIKILRQFLNAKGKVVRSTSATRTLKPGEIFQGKVDELLAKNLTAGEYIVKIKITQGKKVEESSFKITVEKLKKKYLSLDASTITPGNLYFEWKTKNGIQVLVGDPGKVVTMPSSLNFKYTYLNQTGLNNTQKIYREIVSQDGSVLETKAGKWNVKSGQKYSRTFTQTFGTNLVEGSYFIRVRALDWSTNELLAENQLGFTVESK